MCPRAPLRIKGNALTTAARIACAVGAVSAAASGPTRADARTTRNKSRLIVRSFYRIFDVGDALRAISENSAARVVVLAAAGPAFSAGHDLSEMVGCSEETYRELFSLCS